MTNQQGQLTTSETLKRNLLKMEKPYVYEKVIKCYEKFKNYNMFNHLTPGYCIDAGCIAVKRMISITKYGDVMPCPWMYLSLGNFFKEPLKDIIDRGMDYFKKRSDVCLVSNDRGFINKYIVKTCGKNLPVPINQIFSNGDHL